MALKNRKRVSSRSGQYQHGSTTTKTVKGASKIGKGGKIIQLPDVTTTTSTSASGGSSSGGIAETMTPNYSGIILVLLIALFVLAFWDQYIAELWSAVWTGKKPSFQSGIGPMVGGFVFIIILSMLGAIPSLSGMILVFVIGLWVVFFVMGGNTKNVTNILGFLSGGATNKNGNTAPPQRGPS